MFSGFGGSGVLDSELGVRGVSGPGGCWVLGLRACIALRVGFRDLALVLEVTLRLLAKRCALKNLLP